MLMATGILLLLPLVSVQNCGIHLHIHMCRLQSIGSQKSGTQLSTHTTHTHVRTHLSLFVYLSVHICYKPRIHTSTSNSVSVPHSLFWPPRSLYLFFPFVMVRSLIVISFSIFTYLRSLLYVTSHLTLWAKSHFC